MHRKIDANIVDVDALIELVAERPTIWNKSSKSHSSRIAVEKCWKEIGEALRVDENALRRKWKYLRDQFCVELGKVQNSTGAPKWRYFTALEFLRESVNPRIYSKEVYQEESDVDVNEQSSSDYFERHSPKQEGKNKIKIEKTKKKQTNSEKVSVASIADNDSICDNDNRFIANTVFDEDDEHMHFFKSVLPHVRKIPGTKVLTFRGRIQSLVEEFAYGSNTASTEFVPDFPIKGSPPRYSSETCDPIETSD